MEFKKLLVLIVLVIGACGGVRAMQMDADGIGITPAGEGRDDASLDKRKIVVVTDPHVMAPELLVNEGSAWENYLKVDRKLVDYSQRLFDEMIARIKRDLRPGLVLITGDMTKDGELLSHQYVVSKLDELRAAGIRTLVIPGNHDRGNHIDALYYDGDDTYAAEVATDEWFVGQYENYGYGAGSEREGTSLTYCCEPIEGLVVIGIDSGTDGVVSATTLDWVAKKATEARNSGKNVIAMMHHPLIPHFTGFESLVETAVVVNYEAVRNTLADAGISAVFSGHFHTSDIAMDKNADLTKEIYDVNTGSLVSYPCDYRVVTLSDDLSKMSITTEHISELVSGDGFAELAKNRLQTIVQETVASRGENYSLIAPIAAQGYLIHAEGNEPDNPDSAPLLLQTELFAGVIALMMGEDLALSFKDMAYSMLQDRSQYGVEGRENVTNDLTLQLDLPESIIVGIDGLATDSPENGLNTTYYNLAGQRVKNPGKGLYLVDGKKIVVK